jgi:hypothetical protein
VNTYHVHRRALSLSRCKSIVVGAAAVAWLFGLFATRPCNAANILLTDGNSAVTIDPTSSAGVENWSINGQNQLHQEWFWIRTGNTGGQSSIDTLSAPSITPGFPSYAAELTYGSSNGLQIVIMYSLNGAQPGSDLVENIEINNDGTSSQTYHFFEYANFNLGDLTTGQKVTIAPGPGGDTATDVGNGWQEQTSVSPASEYEANDYPSLYDSISSSTTPCTLSDASPSSTGDGEWGFEWDTTLAAKGSYVISGDDNIKAAPVLIPEPVSGLLALFGLSGLCLMRPRRQDAAWR